MFTGIVEAVGTVRETIRKGGALRLTITAPDLFTDLVIGESVSVNGACLTVTTWGPQGACFDAMPETVSRTTLKMLRPGDRVNLERALPATGRLGGHIVQGHVDGVGTVRSMERSREACVLTIEAPHEVTDYLVEKGSVTISGVSLTVTAVDDDSLSVALIPHTLGVTTVGSLKPGDAVNLEADIIGKYVARFMARTSGGRERSEDGLMRLLEAGGFGRVER